MIEATAELYKEMGEFTETIRVTLLEAQAKFGRLTERARALDGLRASAAKRLTNVEKHLQARGQQFMDAKRTARRAVEG